MNCPLCGGDGEHWDVYQYIDPTKDSFDQEWLDAFSADRCNVCKSIYQNPPPTNIREYYSSGKYREEHPSDLKYDTKRAERTLQLVERFNIEPKSCLDIGCGRGLLLKYLEVYFFAKVLGLEYDPDIAEIEEVVYNKDDVEDTFDLITCIHALEHMQEPIKELEWMMSKINPGGTIILEIPTYVSTDLSHLFVPSKVGLEMMLDRLNLEYLIVEDGNICIVLIGDNYSRYKANRVYYSYDSPDFDSPKEYANWIRGEAYDMHSERKTE